MFVGFESALAGAKRPGLAGIRAQNGHSARRCPVRAWVARSGSPLTMSTLLTAKKSEGLWISATTGGCCGGAQGAHERGR